MRLSAQRIEVNGEAFLLYIEKVRVPTLRHGDIVIMDNLGSHKANAVRRAIRACRRQALLPAEILARSLRQVQTLAPQSRKANHRGCLRCYTSDPRHRLIGRVRQLLHQRRV
jgi:hypothetical protein